MKNLKFISVIIILLMTGSLVLMAQNDQPNPTPEQQEAMKKAAEERFHNDWANLNRFRFENTKIGLPAPG